jgi:hypothetical protein
VSQTELILNSAVAKTYCIVMLALALQLLGLVLASVSVPVSGLFKQFGHAGSISHGA